MGLHFYWTYVKCGLDRTKVITNSGHSRIVSIGGHKFEKDEGWATNVSNVFIGILIDYYRIESGILGMDSQLSFVKDPEFRYLIYKYIRSVFLAFVKHNLPPEATEHEIAKFEIVDAITDQEIMTYAGNIIGVLIE